MRIPLSSLLLAGIPFWLPVAGLSKTIYYYDDKYKVEAGWTGFNALLKYSLYVGSEANSVYISPDPVGWNWPKQPLEWSSQLSTGSYQSATQLETYSNASLFVVKSTVTGVFNPEVKALARKTGEKKGTVDLTLFITDPKVILNYSFNVPSVPGWSLSGTSPAIPIPMSGGVLPLIPSVDVSFPVDIELPKVTGLQAKFEFTLASTVAVQVLFSRTLNHTSQVCTLGGLSAMSDDCGPGSDGTPPEPASMVLVASALVSIGIWRRRRQKSLRRVH